MSNLRLLAFAAPVILLVGGRCASAADAGDEPSIEEMFAEIAARKTGGGRATAVSRAKPAAKPAARSSRKPAKFSWTAVAAIKKVERRAGERLSMLQKERRGWQMVQLYIRLEKFKLAARILAPMLKSRDPGPGAKRRWLDRVGEFELEYARVMACLGKSRTASHMLEKHREKLEDAKTAPRKGDRLSTGQVDGFERRQAFVEGYAEARARVDELTAALAQEPDGDKQWALVRLCEPGQHEGKAVLGLKWLVALLDHIEGHPDHKEVVSGNAHWNLYRAYLHYDVYEECIKILELMPEKFPEYGQTKNGNYLWDLGDRYANLGRLKEDQRDRGRAKLSYSKALDTFRLFKTKFRDDRRNKKRERRRGPALPPLVNERIGNMRNAVNRSSGRKR